MQQEGEEIWVRLTGGGPFGLRLGGRSTRWEPLVVAKLHKKSKARAAGVRVGDVVLSINDSRCDVMTLQTASDLVDFSRDLSIQLFRSPTIQVLEQETSSEPSFRQHQQPPPPPQVASRSPTSSPFLSDPKFSSAAHLHPGQPTELFRHHVTSLDSRHQRLLTSPLTSSDAEDRIPVQKFGREGVESKLQPDKTEKSERGGGGGRRWQPGEKAGRPEVKWAPKISDVPESQLENSEWNGEANGGLIEKVKEFTPPSSSLLPKPSFSARAKPDRWQPPGASLPIGEAATAAPEALPMRPESNRRSDAFVHEVIIWSSKTTTEAEKPSGDVDDFQSQKKPLPWQPKGDSNRVDRTEDSQKTPARWQPTSGHGNQPTPVAWQPSQPTTTDSRVVKATDASDQAFRWRPETNNEAKQPPSWQPPQPTVVKETENKEPSSWQPDSERVQGRHRWQPTQPPDDAVDGGFSGGSHRLEEPRHGAPQDGSTSPAVTSLFLRRVVTDGSALVAAGSGSDAEAAPDVSYTGKKRLYADSSFYEDPEHKYPTIEEQIKMARKVALLLTSPVNKNAKGQRMFLKRKEQSSKWIIDPKNLALRPLIIAPPAPEPNSQLLSPVQVEKMRLYGDKSLHDVIPFDVCSMLAAELREEKGRGGRLFAKRRDQADRSSAPETKGLVRVPEPPSFQQQESKDKYVPPQKSNYVTETIARIPPPPAPPAPAPPPVVQEPRDALSSEHLLPVNRLKDMIDLPRAKITPWDSAIEYGTVEPAFEHLRGYRHHHHRLGDYLPYDAERVTRSTGSTLLSQTGRSEPKGQGHSFGERESSSYKGVDSLGSSAYQQDSYLPAQGFAPAVDSSCFIRQAAAAVGSSGYRPVRFQVGTRNFK